MNSGRSHEGNAPASMLLTHTGASHVFMPQYRLSCNKDCQFPAALQDALTAYCYLTQTMHVPADRIVLSGDSAGGNLVLSLLRYLAEFGDALKLGSPRAAWLW